MTNQKIDYRYSESDVNELLADDLSIPATLAQLIHDNGDIGSFLCAKLIEREEAAAEREQLRNPLTTAREFHRELFGNASPPFGWRYTA